MHLYADLSTPSAHLPKTRFPGKHDPATQLKSTEKKQPTGTLRCIKHQLPATMFQHLDALFSNPAPPHTHTYGDENQGSQSLLARIRARIDRELPRDLYLTDATLAAILHISTKTLANRRSLEPDRFPEPMKLAGGRKSSYARDVIVEWLTQEELTARSTVIHRCL